MVDPELLLEQLGSGCSWEEAEDVVHLTTDNVDKLNYEAKSRTPPPKSY